MTLADRINAAEPGDVIIVPCRELTMNVIGAAMKPTFENIATATVTYAPCGCRADCWVRATDSEDEYRPCWGQVQATEEVGYGDGDFGFAHACKGHRELHDGGRYNPLPSVVETA